MAGAQGEGSGERRMLRSRHHAVNNVVSGRQPLARSLSCLFRPPARPGLVPFRVWACVVLTFDEGFLFVRR